MTEASEAHRLLTVDDIADQRAYERERPDFRQRMIEVRRRRRVALGTLMTLAFESRETVRYQVQEMARAERLTTDDEIQAELDAYNSLVPGAERLCATLFLELTSDEQMQEWLPRLVGIERHVVLELAGGIAVRSAPEAQHASLLTRDHVTSAVHYLTFAIDDAAREAISAGEVRVVVDHPAHRESVTLAAATIAELVDDLTC